jgi:CRISPR-associated protein Csm3
MQLTNIITITADLELLTGLRIGGGDTEMHIGGVDNSIIKHPITQEPYLPGSSIKGKIRSLLEWRSGAVKAAPLSWQDYQQANTTQQSHVLHILQLFGLGGADSLTEEQAQKVGPSRLSFWDCSLNADWVQAVKEDYLPLTEVKSENRINRIAGTAEHPRQTERIPAGAKFDFRLSIKQITSDDQTLMDTLLAGLKLLELDSLGGSGSRGYGKIKFMNLKINGEDKSAQFEQVQPFNMS